MNSKEKFYVVFLCLVLFHFFLKNGNTVGKVYMHMYHMYHMYLYLSIYLSIYLFIYIYIDICMLIYIDIYIYYINKTHYLPYSENNIFKNIQRLYIYIYMLYIYMCVFYIYMYLKIHTYIHHFVKLHIRISLWAFYCIMHLNKKLFWKPKPKLIKYLIF